MIICQIVAADYASEWAWSYALGWNLPSGVVDLVNKGEMKRVHEKYGPLAVGDAARWGFSRPAMVDQGGSLYIYILASIMTRSFT